MAVLVVAKFNGDPEQLLAGLRQHVDPVMSRVAPQLGALWHSLGRGPDGLVVVDVWDSADAVQSAAVNPEVQDALQRGGLPQPEFDVYELLDHGAL